MLTTPCRFLVNTSACVVTEYVHRFRPSKAAMNRPPVPRRNYEDQRRICPSSRCFTVCNALDKRSDPFPTLIGSYPPRPDIALIFRDSLIRELWAYVSCVLEDDHVRFAHRAKIFFNRCSRNGLIHQRYSGTSGI